jgi:hypothetical protein
MKLAYRNEVVAAFVNPLALGYAGLVELNDFSSVAIVDEGADIHGASDLGLQGGFRSHLVRWRGR